MPGRRRSARWGACRPNAETWSARLYATLGSAHSRLKPPGHIYEGRTGRSLPRVPGSRVVSVAAGGRSPNAKTARSRTVTVPGPHLSCQAPWLRATTLSGRKAVAAFIQAAKDGRIWDREPTPRRPG
jgi:hypothetical protein